MGLPLFVSLMIVMLGALVLLALRFLNRGWWRSALIRRFSMALPVIGLAGVGMFVVSISTQMAFLRNAGLLLAGIVMVLEFMLLVTLPLSSLVRAGGRVIEGRLFRINSNSDQSEVNLSRRKFIGGAAASIPLATLGMGVAGFGRAFTSANVCGKEITIADLPPDLVGLKILHLSDSHLGPWVKLQDIETILSDAVEHEPDMVLMTGDIADDLSILPEALKLVDQLPASMGKYACLGNHEHYRGLSQVRRIFDSSPVSLMVDEGIALCRGTGSIWLGAIDDPRRMSGNHDQFYHTALGSAFGGSRTDDFRILMSHRPSIFDIASENRIDLTLAGHTHGVQVGFMGRSMFDNFANESYLWGHYFIGESHLYTSSGVGHWFPFRLGCPPEAPIITLG